jgi:hypothetical protein
VKKKRLFIESDDEGEKPGQSQDKPPAAKQAWATPDKPSAKPAPAKPPPAKATPSKPAPPPEAVPPPVPPNTPTPPTPSVPPKPRKIIVRPVAVDVEEIGPEEEAEDIPRRQLPESSVVIERIEQGQLQEQKGQQQRSRLPVVSPTPITIAPEGDITCPLCKDVFDSHVEVLNHIRDTHMKE